MKDIFHIANLLPGGEPATGYALDIPDELLCFCSPDICPPHGEGYLLLS